MEKNLFAKTVRAGIFGVVVGDALGVPVEFTSRAERDADPVTDMREYGTHYQPKGTWSDDSSMTFATMDGLIQFDIFDSWVMWDVMNKFVLWLEQGEYTPYGTAFDVGNTCSKAIMDYKEGVEPTGCGGIGERDNGNGSLMRIMPFALLSAGEDDYWSKEKISETSKIVQAASSLTHGHSRSRIACLLYTSACHELICNKEDGVETCIQREVDGTFAYFDDVDLWYYWGNSAHMLVELLSNKFWRIRNIKEFRALSRKEIRSSGYVLDTLEAAFWCLLNTENYRDCVLAAVNLGEDTDTVGAVAGGLAGLYYGYDGIPKEWVEVLAKKEWIDGLCGEFAEKYGDE